MPYLFTVGIPDENDPKKEHPDETVVFETTNLQEFLEYIRNNGLE